MANPRCIALAYLDTYEKAGEPAGERWKVQWADALAFATQCLVKAGAMPNHASDHATMMVFEDQRGVYSEGIAALDRYICELGAFPESADAEVLSDTPTTAVVDGHGSLGGYVSNFCVKLAIEKAKAAGIGCVVCRGSNYNGGAGCYSLLAADQGMICLSASNTQPGMCPTRSAPPPSLGNNALAFAASGTTGEIALDMGVSTSVPSKIQALLRERKLMPLSWGVDSTGKETTNPLAALRGGGLAPLGGTEERAGYKGYGLALTAEVLCSCLSGGTISPDMPGWRTPAVGKPADLSHCFIVINPAFFNPAFPQAVQHLADKMRALPRAGDLPVLVPGDLEAAKEEQQKDAITYEGQAVNIIKKVSASVGVPIPPHMVA